MNKKTHLKPPPSWPAHAQELYWEYHRKLHQRLKSARARLLILAPFFRFQEREGLSFREFPASSLDAYFKRFSLRRRESIASALRSWLRFLFQRKELLVPLHEELERHRFNHRRQAILTHEQVLQLLQLPPLDEPMGLRDRAFLETAYATGMRHGELLALDLTDVDMNTGWIHIRDSKNTHQRMVPLTRWAIHFLTRYLHEARPQLTKPHSPNALWINKWGNRVTLCQGVRERMKINYQAQENLGFSLVPHQLRHACATHLLMGGAPMTDVQVLLGHLEIRSTEIYTHITPTYLRSVHERTHPRNNGTIPDLGIEGPEAE